MKSRLANLYKTNKAFLLFLVLMFAFRSAIADWNDVPTGSMKPTIIEGDRVMVNKMAYDIRLPFTHISLLKMADPQRGDIIVFDSKASDKRLIKRVVGVPGDVVELRSNVLYINNQRLSYQDLNDTHTTSDKIENLLGLEHAIRVKKHGSSLSSFAPTRVPKHYYLALGDNRDNSADSRVIGFVPRNEIVGQSGHVVMSLNYDNYYLPRADRFFHKL